MAPVRCLPVLVLTVLTVLHVLHTAESFGPASGNFELCGNYCGPAWCNGKDKKEGGGRVGEGDGAWYIKYGSRCMVHSNLHGLWYPIIPHDTQWFRGSLQTLKLQLPTENPTLQVSPLSLTSLQFDSAICNLIAPSDCCFPGQAGSLSTRFAIACLPRHSQGFSV